MNKSSLLEIVNELNNIKDTKWTFVVLYKSSSLEIAHE